MSSSWGARIWMHARRENDGLSKIDSHAKHVSKRQVYANQAMRPNYFERDIFGRALAMITLGSQQTRRDSRESSCCFAGMQLLFRGNAVA
eukprot:6199489-Pleurochrysis_carterae.AAC.1